MASAARSGKRGDCCMLMRYFLSYFRADPCPQLDAERLRMESAAREQSQQLVHDVRRGDRRDLGVVVAGRDLDDVGTHERQVLETLGACIRSSRL